MSTWTPPRHLTRGVKRKFRESIVSEYKGREQRLVRTTDLLGNVTHYAGAKGQERKVRQVSRCGSVTDYKGPKGKEYRVRDTSSTGWVEHYEKMADGKNIMVRRVGPDGTLHFKTVKGQRFDTARSHMVLPSGGVKYFEGDKLWEEREVRYVSPTQVDENDGSVYHHEFHYEGEHFHERLVRLESHDKDGITTWHYEGEKGRERKVRRVDPPEENEDGTVYHCVAYFEGWKHEERKVRMEIHDEDEITTYYYEGEKGREREVRMEIHDKDGITKVHYDDRGNKERMDYPNGKVAHYEWRCIVPPQRTLQRVRHPDGRVDYFRNFTSNDDSDNEDAPWNVRSDCLAKERMLKRTFPNGDEHHYSIRNNDRILRIMAMGQWLPRSQVLWYRVREWFRKRAIVLHWQEQTQMRLAAPGGEGRLADRVAFVTDFCA